MTHFTTCAKVVTGYNLHIFRGMPEITLLNDNDFWLRGPKFGYFISRRPLSSNLQYSLDLREAFFVAFRRVTLPSPAR
jgi:hypothetical protein